MTLTVGLSKRIMAKLRTSPSTRCPQAATPRSPWPPSTMPLFGALVSRLAFQPYGQPHLIHPSQFQIIFAAFGAPGQQYAAPLGAKVSYSCPPDHVLSNDWVAVPTTTADCQVAAPPTHCSQEDGRMQHIEWVDAGCTDRKKIHLL